MFDIPGMLLLIVTMSGFGWLCAAARRLRNGFLKWGGLVLFGLLTLLSTALLVLALAGYSRFYRQHDNPVASLQVGGTAAQLARGEQLAHLCVDCHTANLQLPLSGGNMVAKFGLPPMGTLYAPNLTPGGNIRDWSDGEVMRAIREGIHQNGRSLLLMPPLASLSDDDAQALVAYLRSQPATGEPTPDNRLNLIGAILLNGIDFQTAHAPVGRVSAPAPNTREYGKYLVDVILCRDCHGEQLQGKAPSSEPGPPPGPNLTMIVPAWTEEQFMTFFNTGMTPWGPVPVDTMADGTSQPRMPWPIVRAATTGAELKAIYDYLHSLPAVDGPVTEK